MTTEAERLPCQADGCGLLGRQYPSGWWCDEAHAPWRFAADRNLSGRPAPGRYCPGAVCYCGYCPQWRPMPSRRVIPAQEALALIEERRKLQAKVDQDLGPARARALRERNRRGAR